MRDVLAELEVQPLEGLAPEEVERRRALHGPNRLPERARAGWHQVLARQFGDVLVAILAVGALVSLVIGELLDAGAILAILLLNGLLGFLQEWKAERALDALQGMLSPRCRVLRGGREREVDAAELVPGDVVPLASGDRVPADLRLLEAGELELDESALTGESASVAKDPAPVERERPLAERASMAWMGTTVTRGRGRGVVTATGSASEFGRIAVLTGSVERDPTPLQRRLQHLGRQLGLLALGVSLLVGVAGWWLGRPPLEMFMTGVSLAVAVVPEGLPAVVTITLALGVRQMVRRRALPRRLQATETLGSATTILTDKTGTLTENVMTVRSAWLPAGEVELRGRGYGPEGELLAQGQAVDPASRPDLRALLECGVTCNHAGIELREGRWERVGEPTEAALVVAAGKAGVERRAGKVLAEHAFDSTRKRMAVVLADGAVFAKGAPEVILERCTRVLVGEGEEMLDGERLAEARQAYRELARGGMRTLALARGELREGLLPGDPAVERELTLLGIVGILDPPRPEVPEAVRRARQAGLRVLMVTGDAPETARAIAERIGLEVEQALTGPELEELEDARLLEALARPVLLARATPEHKLRVARLLEESGQVVAMTGDGVNDAPALKEADIGIAMGVRGTDVAREAADLVLTDDNFASIVNAIEEGRREYENIRKFVRYLLSSNIGETVAIFLTIVLRAPLILLPVQILWINVVTDAVTAVALGLEPAERDLMRRPPRRRDEPVLDREGVLSVLALGSYIGLVTLALFLRELRIDPEQGLARARSLAFTAMVVLEQVNLFNHRALRTPLARIGFFSNPWLLVALGGTAVLHLAALYVPAMQRVLYTTPLTLEDWGVLVLAALPLFLVPEARKWLRWRRAGHG